MEKKRSRSWCITYFPTNQERDQLWFKSLAKNKGIRYFVVGYETCPSTKKKHFQGYISFKNAKTFKATKKWFGLDRIHIEAAVAGDHSNKKYCEKENKFIEVGEPIKQGKRNDIETAIDIVEQTGSVREVLKVVKNYQAVRHVELYLKYNEPEELRTDLQVINIWGPSGKGKTRHVYEKETRIFRPISFKWWEGYDGHSVVLLDDIRKDFCKFHELLNLLDIYPYRVECKGSSRQLRAKKIYITTPIPLVDMYECREDLYQLERRITHTHHINDLL
jgi:hypothetical protein